MSAIDEILINRAPGETRAAFLAQGRLVELLIERDRTPSLIGNVYLGRVGKPAPGAAAWFVDIGAERAGFLAHEDAAQAMGPRGPLSARPSEGQAIIVQVTRDAAEGKGPRLSTSIGLAGHRLVLNPAKSGVAVSRRIGETAERARLEAAIQPHLAPGEGIVLRTAAAGASGAALQADIGEQRSRWQQALARAAAAAAPALLLPEPDLPGRILRDHAGVNLRSIRADDRHTAARIKAGLARMGLGDRVVAEYHEDAEAIFDRHDVEDQIAQALEPVVALPSGGSLSIGTLAALTAIDIDSARQTGAGRFADMALAVNLEAAAVIAHQVRLRNLAGLIVVDFLHVESARHRARVAEALAAAFASDPVPVHLGGWTSLGLFELTRKRLRTPLSAQLTEACGACAGTGRIKTAETVALELLRAAARAADAAPGRPVAAAASSEVIAALNGPAKTARAALERTIGRPLALRVADRYGRERFEFIAG